MKKQRAKIPPKERFEQKVMRDPNSGCWLWEGNVNNTGYGTFNPVGRGGKTLKAHRFSYATYRTEIPPGLCVLHKCDVPSCVNPDHLFLGTHTENMRDMAAKGRSKRGREAPAHLKGERAPWSKLTEQQAREIKVAVGAGRLIGPRYGISAAQVNLIRRGKLWKHLDAVQV